ncbi:MAG: CHAT domain-containing protein [Anaerolineae bacterium]|nr:CHAT domain-containing protein [Anaerolineae bacterium]
MPTLPKYLDFDLAIQRSGEQLRVRVLNSPGGQADAPFVLPFSTDKLENLILHMGHTRTKTRSSNSKQMQAAKELGGGLFHALLNETVARCWETSLTIAAERRVGLRVRLRLNEAPELADLPWEYLYDDSPLNRFYHLSKETPLVRFLELADPPVALTVTPPLNILVIISSPKDDEYVPLDVSKEESLLREALSDLEQSGLVTITRLSKPTLSALQSELRDQEFHILHFIGHGQFDSERGRGFLIWEDDQHASVRVDGERFARLIKDHGSLRLVLLNACEGARPTLSDPFGGFAQRIIQQGIPAVIAMQFEITDQAAIAFAREFYAALADNYPVEAALAEARKAIYALPNETEWGTPVLYSRAPDGIIFNVQGAPQPLAVPTPRPGQEPADANAAPAGTRQGDRRTPLAPAPAVTDTSPQSPAMDEFNPVGRWNIQVQDMVGSRLFVEFNLNGTFQMMQQVGLYQVPVNGSWSYNPLTRQLSLQGVVNTFQPFVLLMTLGGALPDGYGAVGNDGIGYVLTPASSN